MVLNTNDTSQVIDYSKSIGFYGIKELTLVQKQTSLRDMSTMSGSCYTLATGAHSLQRKPSHNSTIAGVGDKSKFLKPSSSRSSSVSANETLPRLSSFKAFLKKPFSTTKNGSINGEKKAHHASCTDINTYPGREDWKYVTEQVPQNKHKVQSSCSSVSSRECGSANYSSRTADSLPDGGANFSAHSAKPRAPPRKRMQAPPPPTDAQVTLRQKDSHVSTLPVAAPRNHLRSLPPPKTGSLQESRIPTIKYSSTENLAIKPGRKQKKAAPKPPAVSIEENTQNYNSEEIREKANHTSEQNNNDLNNLKHNLNESFEILKEDLNEKEIKVVLDLYNTYEKIQQDVNEKEIKVVQNSNDTFEILKMDLNEKEIPVVKELNNTFEILNKDFNEQEKPVVKELDNTFEIIEEDLNKKTIPVVHTLNDTFEILKKDSNEKEEIEKSALNSAVNFKYKENGKYTHDVAGHISTEINQNNKVKTDSVTPPPTPTSTIPVIKHANEINAEVTVHNEKRIAEDDIKNELKGVYKTVNNKTKIESIIEDNNKIDKEIDSLFDEAVKDVQEHVFEAVDTHPELLKEKETLVIDKEYTNVLIDDPVIKAHVDEVAKAREPVIVAYHPASAPLQGKISDTNISPVVIKNDVTCHSLFTRTCDASLVDKHTKKTNGFTPKVQIQNDLISPQLIKQLKSSTLPKPAQKPLFRQLSSTPYRPSALELQNQLAYIMKPQTPPISPIQKINTTDLNKSISFEEINEIENLNNNNIIESTKNHKFSTPKFMLTTWKDEQRAPVVIRIADETTHGSSVSPLPISQDNSLESYGNAAVIMPPLRRMSQIKAASNNIMLRYCSNKNVQL